MSLLDFFGGRGKIPPPPYQLLGADMHSHLIPGIDDGARDLEDSLALVHTLCDMGIKRVVTTPHIMSDAYPNTPETILNGLAKLKEALKSEDIEVEIEAAAEYYLDEWFVETLEREPLMTFGGPKKYLLFETSYVSQPLSLQEIIFRMQSLGYTPVMAHPERYQYFWEIDNISPIAELKERGSLLQVNLTSFAGTRGKRAAKIARDLARAGLIDFVATDLHRIAQVQAIKKAFDTSKELRHLLESGKLLNTTL